MKPQARKNEKSTEPEFPVLTNTEWVWLFNAAARSFATELRNNIDEIDRVERQMRVHGALIPSPMFLSEKSDPASKRDRLEEQRVSNAKLLKAALLLSQHAYDAEMQDFGEAVAATFGGRFSRGK
jgi:hypothetical protein